MVAKEVNGTPMKMEVDLPPLGVNDVTVEVKFCGLCYSDLAMHENMWGMTSYPFVGGHEVAGEIVEIGEHVTAVKIGDKVGVGWASSFCNTCNQCVSGQQSLCVKPGMTVVGRHGGFAKHVRCSELCAYKLPGSLDLATSGPLLCGGNAVFHPLLAQNVLPTQKVGVVGIGGLGHMALQFMNKWGCHVAAFTSSPSKAELAKKLGAHEIIVAKEKADFEKHAGRFDFILVAVADVSLDWNNYIITLGPRGNLHFVGTVPEPLGINSTPLMFKQQSVSASPVGGVAATRTMLDFAARHDVKPMIESFKMSELGKAYEHLKAGKPRFRIVLENDL